MSLMASVYIVSHVTVKTLDVLWMTHVLELIGHRQNQRLTKC